MEPLIRKSWYTLPEAADYLTRNTQGAARVSAPDLLQLAAAGQIKLSVQLFSITPAKTGEFVLLMDTRASASVPYPKCPTETRVVFYDGEKTRDRRLRVEVLNDDGPHFLTFQSPTPDTRTGEQLELIYVDANLGLLRLWWRLSMRDEQNPAHLVAAAKAADPALADSPVYFRRTDTDEAQFARVVLSALPDDTLVGVALDQLDALLSDSDNGPAGGQTTTSPDHLPEDVDLLMTAWRLFWKGRVSERDRSTLPLREDVKRWLMDRGMSGKLADAGVTMITPDWARKGGRR